MDNALRDAQDLLHSLDHLDDDEVPPQTFLREITEWMDFGETGLIHDELPKPTLWRVLIFPKQAKTVSKGGIVLAQVSQDIERHQNYIGQVVALGPLAGKSEKFLNPDWREWRDSENKEPAAGSVVTPRYLWDVKVGDWVIFGRFSGMHVDYKGVGLLSCNDDDILDVIASPANYRVHV